MELVVAEEKACNRLRIEVRGFMQKRSKDISKSPKNLDLYYLDYLDALNRLHENSILLALAIVKSFS